MIRPRRGQPRRPPRSDAGPHPRGYNPTVTPPLVILHNPASRRGQRVLESVRRVLREVDPDGSRHEFVALDDLARLPIPGERLVAVGGDGTVNAALSWLLAKNLEMPLGIVPAGTGNNLARGLELDLDPEGAASVALRGRRTRPIDGVIYRADGEAPRLLIQSGALGFPAEIGARYDRLRRFRLFRWIATPLGPLVYSGLALAGLVGQKLREWSGDPLLEVRSRFVDEPGNERFLAERVFAVFVGTERSLGGGFVPCPHAEVDDGHVDLCLVRAGTSASYLRLFARVLRGGHLVDRQTVAYFKSPGPVSLELSQPREFLGDGDIWTESDRFEIDVLPRRFPIVVR